jgi:hypothetical protein
LQENLVTGAVNGYERMAGKPAFTLLHVGSGLANGIAKLQNAGRANTTIVNVVGGNATYDQRVVCARGSPAPGGVLTDDVVAKSIGLLLPENAILVADSATTEAALYRGTEDARAHDYWRGHRQRIPRGVERRGGVPRSATRAQTADEFHQQFEAAMNGKGPHLIEAKIVQNLRGAIDASITRGLERKTLSGNAARQAAATKTSC